MTGWLRTTGLLLLLGLAAATPAKADGPGRLFKRVTDGRFAAPDRTVRVEQYFKDMGDRGYLYQFWIFDRVNKHPVLLNKDETIDDARYRAGFRFSPNSQWLVRMQKIGSGTETLHLYKRTGDSFAEATAKPLGDAAWDFFFTQKEAEGVRHDPNDPYTLDHMQVGLLKGFDTNYAWLGQNWPDSRYLVLGLSFDIQGEDTPFPWVEDWRCVYDLTTGTFSVPAAFAENNAKARHLPNKDGRYYP